MSTKQAVRSKNCCIRLRPGLEARELEQALVRSHRSNDIARRSLSFYLDDMQRRGLHQELGFSSAVHFACQRLSMNRRHARDLVAVGKALRELLLIDQAFCDGHLAWSKLRLLVSVATPENEAAWLERALELSCHQLEAQMRGAEFGRAPRKDGKGTPSVRFQFGAKLAPAAHEILQQARRKICAEAGAELDDAEVLLAMAEYRLREMAGAPGIQESRDSLYRVSVGQCPSCAKSHVNTEDGPIELSDAEASTIHCDAHVVGGGKAAPTSPALRKRVLARDGGRCVHCGSASNLHAHHIVFRANGGKTDAANLITACNRCHGMIHDGFLVVKGQAPHQIKITDRDGRELAKPIRHSGLRISVEAINGGTRVPPEHGKAVGKNLSQLIGQQHVIEGLRVACQAARVAERPLRHILFTGPPGLGKTTMARAVAVETEAPFIERTGVAVSCLEDLSVVDGCVLFIDEIHGLPRSVAELLYDVMDKKKVCVIGATTNPNLMPKPLRDRFTVQEEFLSYSDEELADIVSQASCAPIDSEASLMIAQASMGTPRKALSLLASVEDHLLANEYSIIDRALVEQALKQRRMDHRGFGPNHIRTLNFLRQRNRPCGQARLACSVGLDRQVFRETVETELLQYGLIEVTPQGIMAV